MSTQKQKQEPQRQQFPLLAKPRPWSRIHAGTAPGYDARWRGVSRRVRSINPIAVMDLQRRAREENS